MIKVVGLYFYLILFRDWNKDKYFVCLGLINLIYENFGFYGSNEGKKCKLFFGI